MEWIKKLLEKHTKDGVVNQEELIKDINKEFPNHAVPKEQYNTLADTKTKLETDIKERDTQLEDLKKVDAKGLQTEIERLQGENKAATEKYEKDLKDLQLNNAIKLALNGKVHDEDIAAQLIKKDELVLSEEGKVVGLDEQVASLKEGKAFLFKEETTDPNTNTDPKPGFKVGNPPATNIEATNNAVSAAFGNAKTK